jgi:hypothetical protein
MTRERMKNDIRTALINTWLNVEGGTSLTAEQRREAENQIQRLAEGIANAVDNYVASELNRMKSFLMQPGAFTGRTVPILQSDQVTQQSSGTIVSIEPGSIRNYTPSSG